MVMILAPGAKKAAVAKEAPKEVSKETKEPKPAPKKEAGGAQ
jgi:hypothetical protein